MYVLIKRSFDFSAALLLILMLSVPMAAISVLIVLFNGRPVFFVQERPGKYARLFRIYKFRTMDTLSESTDIAAHSLERVTRVGRFLRSSGLDELPQLLNILKGDMSFIGPRPLLPEYLPLYSAEQNRRHEVRPGLTGNAQVNGRNALTWEEKFAKDIEYANTLGFATDFRILLKTVQYILTRKGVNADNTTTVQPFRGNKRPSTTREPLEQWSPDDQDENAEKAGDRL